MFNFLVYIIEYFKLVEKKSVFDAGVVFLVYVFRVFLFFGVQVVKGVLEESVFKRFL